MNKATAVLALAFLLFTCTPTTQAQLGGIVRHERTEVVSPIVGHPVASGLRLVNVLRRIADATAEYPWLVKLEPGTYDLGAATLTMKPYVDIEGSGEAITIVTSSGPVTVAGADNSELRMLTVANVGSATGEVHVVLIDGVSQRMSKVTVAGEASTATGHRLNGVMVRGGANLDLGSLTIQLDGGDSCTGVVVTEAATTLVLRNSSVTVGSAGGVCYGAGASGGATAVLVDSAFRASNVFHHCVVSGTGALVRLRGTRAIHASASGTAVLATGPSSGGGRIEITHSTIEGKIGAIAPGYVRIGSTQFSGSVGVSSPPGEVKCVASFNGDFGALDSTCAVAP